MNAKAHIITGIGRATATLLTRTAATATLLIRTAATATLLTRTAATATLLTRTAATAAMTEATGLRRYLRVTPQEPQTILWLVPQAGIDYQVESNAKWRVI